MHLAYFCQGVDEVERLAAGIMAANIVVAANIASNAAGAKVDYLLPSWFNPSFFSERSAAQPPVADQPKSLGEGSMRTLIQTMKG